MDTEATKSPTVPFPSAEERDALSLEFQRLMARLVRVGLLSQFSATSAVRGMNRERAKAEEIRYGLPKLVLELLLAIEEGTLKEREHFLRPREGVIAVHLESAAPAMFRAKRSSLTARDMRHLFHFGWLHHREVVLARSERLIFGPEQDRRRTVVLDLAKAREFVGSGRSGVPIR